MLGFVIKKYKNSKGLINYFLLTYLDKIISFALPLSILFIIKDKTEYTFVEVAFSYATLAMIIIELGVSNYLFFGYKNAGQKEEFLQRALVNFKFLLMVYCIISIPLLIGIHYYDKTLFLLFSLVIIRTLYTLFLNFYANIFRLKDRPSGIYLTSIVINVLSFILLMLAGFFSWPYKLMYFFLPSLALIIVVCFRFFVFEFRLFKIKLFIDFLAESLKFSWPIILNVLAMSFINNYAKIYAYGHLSEQETVQISYVMRIGLIIQLTHSAFSSYFSKEIFMNNSQKLGVKIFKQYSLVLLVSAGLVLLVIFVTNLLFSSQIRIPLTSSTILFLTYIILWCYIGYLEIYFGIMNANKRILYYSIISSVLYVIMLKVFNHPGIFELSLFMSITAAFNLLLVILGLLKLKVLHFKQLPETKTSDLS